MSYIAVGTRILNMSLKFNLIAACCENMGIGINGDLPWRLKKEMAFFTNMTTKTEDPDKKNVIIIGRRSWDCIPDKYKPLQNRLNFVLSSKEVDLSQFKDTYLFNSWDAIVEKLNDTDFKQKYEAVWICGGRQLYEDAMKSDHFYRLYLTRIKEKFECDTFFPKLVENIKRVSDNRVPQGIQEEKGIKWEFEVWENTKFKENI